LSKLSKIEKCSGADSLNSYLDSVRHAPFDWGVHDCVIFAKEAAEAQTGATYPLPSYTGIRGALEVCKRVCLVSELDKLFERCAHVPPVGSIVAVEDTKSAGIGYRLGVVVSDKAAFVSPKGLVFDKLRPDTDIYWIVK
jgi:hypothetical protein